MSKRHLEREEVIELLDKVKQQESKSTLKSVRIDTKTIILSKSVESTERIKERYNQRINESRRGFE